MQLAAANAALQSEIQERELAERRLRESEERLRSVLEHSLDAVYRRNLHTDRYDYISPMLETITGISVEEMCSGAVDAVLEGVHLEDLPRVEAEIQRTSSAAKRDGRATGSLEYRFKGRDGCYLWLADHITILTDAEGAPLYRLGTVQDVTDQKQAEEELRRARDELSSLIAISQNLVSTLRLSSLLEELLHQLHTVIDYDEAAVYLLEGHELAVMEYVGAMNRDDALAVRLPLEECVACRDVVVEMRTVRVDDMLEDSYLAQILLTKSAPIQRQLTGECRSWLGMPLVVKGEAIGMLRLSHAEPYHFSDAQARLAATVATYAAIAIENARLYARVQESAAIEERQRLARELHDSITQVLYGIGLVAHVAMNSVERDPEKARGSIGKVLSLVQTGLAEMRALVLELRPELLASEGPVVAIEKQAVALRERQGVPVHTELADEPDVSPDAEEALYRIAGDNA